MTTPKPGGSQPSTRKPASSSPSSISRRSGKTVKAAVDDFLLDRQSQNHSPQTLRWHTIALDHFVTYLEQQPQVTYLQDLETVHIRAWLVFLEKEVGAARQSARRPYPALVCAIDARLLPLAA